MQTAVEKSAECGVEMDGEKGEKVKDRRLCDQDIGTVKLQMLGKKPSGVNLDVSCQFAMTGRFLDEVLVSQAVANDRREGSCVALHQR